MSVLLKISTLEPLTSKYSCLILNIMKKTLLTALLFSTVLLSAQNSSDTCTLANEAAAITAPGVFTVDAINGSQMPPEFCVGSATNVTVGEWYRYIPSEDAFMTITTDLPQNSGGDTRVHIYSGNCDALVCEGGDDDSGSIGNGFLSIASLDVTGGQTYYIVFDDRWRNDGFQFELLEGDPPPPPTPAPVEFTTQNISVTGSNRAVVDMNGDQLDDLVSISNTNINIQEQLVGGGFQEVNVATTNADFSPSWSLAAADYNADGFTDLLYGGGSGVTFMRSNGSGGFTEVSGSEYVFSQRSNFADINNDGHLDAFVCHDVAPNVYYINDGNGNLTFNQGGIGDYSSGGNYGSVWIDFNNDRNLDMFLAKCGGEEARRTNQMHLNNGDGTYTEIATAIGLDDPMQTWSSAWGDFDNDGDMDVFVGASSGTHKLMRNDSGTFVDVTGPSGISVLTATGIENASYDFDNDGNLDVVSNGNILFGNGDLTFDVHTNMLSGGNGSFGDLNNDGFVDAFDNGTIYYSDGNSNNWLSICTIGTAGNSNINGIGARIEIHTPSGVQIRDVRSGEGFRHMSTLNTHFGIGSDTTIDNIIVYWPSGIVDNIPNPNINERICITEGLTLSIEDESLVGLVIHPNPVKDILYFETPINLNGRIATVFDINGKKILNEKLEDNALNVSQLQTGIYILRLEYEGKTLTRKLIKD